MPVLALLKCCERFLSVVASLLSIATFIAVIQVKSKVREYHKVDKFHTQRQSILDQLEGFILSIKNDNLKDDSIRKNMYTLLLELQTYTNLSYKTRCIIKESIKSLDNPVDDWKVILDNIIR